MIDKILLSPYYLALKLRHGLYNKGIKKVHQSEVPSIGIGNITVGGTGKTPHTEMLLGVLMEDQEWREKNVTVLSRGYKRETKGFQQVTLGGSSYLFGDEPVQIKRKFPGITVAVDKDRNEGCRFLCHPDELQTSKKARRCLEKTFDPADLIILDDAFQYRALKTDISIVLIDYNRPIFKDHLMPMGRLRDLPERLGEADIVIVTKCPPYMEEEEKAEWIKNLKIKDTQHIFFTYVGYCQMEPVYPEGESRYLYSSRLVLFTGIANDRPMKQFLSGTYKVVRHLSFPDHHKFSSHDIKSIKNAADDSPTAVVATTEKDSQRLKDCPAIPDTLKRRTFRLPIQVEFIGEGERERFKELIFSMLKAR